MAMWDWEIINYLKAEGVSLLAPLLGLPGRSRPVVPSLPSGSCERAGSCLPGQSWRGRLPAEHLQSLLLVARRVRRADPRKVRAKDREEERQGTRRQRKAIPDAQAREDWDRIRDTVHSLTSATRATSRHEAYRAVRDELDEGEGALRWDQLPERVGLLGHDPVPRPGTFSTRSATLSGAARADTVSMLTKFIVHRSLRVPVMMSHLYPFLMGQGRWKHERIPEFPRVDDPENYVPGGSLRLPGSGAQSFATEWNLRRKVLRHRRRQRHGDRCPAAGGRPDALKARSHFERLVMVEGELSACGLPGSDCRNGR